MVDPDRVRRLLQLLKQFRSRLEDLADLDPEDYVDDRALAGRYLVQASAQVCINLANHIIASEGSRTPTDVRDAFTVLEERDILTSDIAERLRSLADLRNRLVHLYDDVDDGLVHDALRHGLDDRRDFARAVAALVD
jgi:uncharacterized protein YutE (UPF0331/DUF86 family)